MASKKKSKSAKPSAKSKKKLKKPAARKKVVKRAKAKPARKPKAARKAAPKKPVARPAQRPAVRPVLAPVKASAEERIGIVTHYYSHLQVAIILIEQGMLRTGDMVHIKGHTSDFKQRVESMELDHVHVDEARAGQSFGLRVKEHAREHDAVYRILPM